MKFTIISLVLVLFTVGCSKKESANTPIRIAIAHGDIAPAEITTNIYHGKTYYIIQIKFSSAKEAELCKLAQQYPNREVEVALGSSSYKFRMPDKTLKPTIQWGIASDSFDDASATEADLKGLSQ
jgi:hypothetical protein